MHLRCCSIAARAQIKVVELRVAHPRVLESLKKKLTNEQIMQYFIVGVKNIVRKFLYLFAIHEHHHART